ncbi:MAG: hypothetical protein AAF488_11480 [Planctomycetota bacterium]
MRPIAYLTSSCMIAGDPDERSDRWEHDFMFDPMLAAARPRELRLEPVVWDDPQLEVDAYEAFVVGTTWDYAERPDQFLALLDRVTEKRPLFNPVEVIRWNLDKGYLADLAKAGAPVVPTLEFDRADAQAVAAGFAEFGGDEVVVKPRVGASAWRQVRLAKGQPLPAVEELPPGRCLVQPFLDSVPLEGEWSFVFLGGEFSHCAQKIPASGDYRVQSMFGAREVAVAPTPHQLEAAQSVLRATESRFAEHDPLLYARVDMVKGREGQLEVMEVELIEPYLYPEQGPELGERFVQALVQKLA